MYLQFREAWLESRLEEWKSSLWNFPSSGNPLFEEEPIISQDQGRVPRDPLCGRLRFEGCRAYFFYFLNQIQAGIQQVHDYQGDWKKSGWLNCQRHAAAEAFCMARARALALRYHVDCGRAGVFQRPRAIAPSELGLYPCRDFRRVASRNRVPPRARNFRFDRMHPSTRRC